jgi:hypothetical protein
MVFGSTAAIAVQVLDSLASASNGNRVRGAYSETADVSPRCTPDATLGALPAIIAKFQGVPAKVKRSIPVQSNLKSTYVHQCLLISTNL